MRKTAKIKISKKAAKKHAAIKFVNPDPKKAENASKKFVNKFAKAIKILADR